jgi:cysteine desulfurase
LIYLDHAASTPLLSKALKVLTHSLNQDFANPSASHKLGLEINQKVDKCRDKFITLLNGNRESRVIFTSSATESNNIIIKGILNDGDTVWVSFADHSSIVKASCSLEKKGVKIKSIPLIEGSIDVDNLLRLISSKDKMIVLTVVNNSTGSIINLEIVLKKIRDIAPNIHIHLDGVQAFGKVPFISSYIDSISISSHKIGGPKGVAALYLSSEIVIRRLVPLFDGGGQEYGIRSSTVPAPLIFAFEAAATFVIDNMEREEKRVRNLMDGLKKSLKKNISPIIFVGEIGSPYILLLVLPGVSSDIVMRHLEMDNIFVSSSSACSSKIRGKNEVYSSLGIKESYHKQVLRVSLSHITTEVELSCFIEKVSSCYKKLKRLKR